MATSLGSITIGNVAFGNTAAIALALGNVAVWQKEEPTPATGPWLCFTAEDADSTIQLKKVGSPNSISLETSKDGSTWTDYNWTDHTGDTLTLTDVGDKVYFRAKTENSTISTNASSYYMFVGTGKFAASGNIQSLLKADCSRTDALSYCYRSMFSGCTSLTQAPALPATTLASSCYNNMFYGCTSLTTAPALPATTLASNCYQAMFGNCASLTTAPALPATTLASSCYQGMFFNCTSLADAPALPATTLASFCYNNMFAGCTKLASIEVSFSAWDTTVATNGWV